MTSRNSGRHRAPASEKTTATAFTLPQIPRPHLPGGAARPVAKAGAVIAVSGGLVASLGLQANAAPITAAPMASSASTVSSHPVSSTTVVASDVPLTLASGLVAAPQSPQVAAGQFGEIGFTAKAKPKPAAMARTSRPFSQRSSRSATRSSVSATDATTNADQGSTDQGSTDQGSTDQATAPVDSAPATIKAGAAGSSEFGASVLAIAARYDGINYRYGGTTPAGFDCSGYTSYVLAQVGVDLPRTSGSQRAGTTRISRSEAVAGDLVFMPGHVGIYAGNGMMWDSPRSGKDVSKRPVYSSSATFGRVG